MPKRKYQEALGDDNNAEQDVAAERPADDDDNNAEQRDELNGGSSLPSTSAIDVSSVENGEKPAKQKKSVRWSNVTVYLFPRQQGFTCVPSSGGVTLGMTNEHSAVQNFTLFEHEMECRKNRQQALQKQQQQQQHPDTSDSDEEMEESDDDEEDDPEEVDEEDDEEEKGDEEEEEEEEEVYEDETCTFPISISVRQRRSLLREAGCQVDLKEREDCQFIRRVGCQCQTVCNPDECSCSINKIKCQVDRFSYPCGCTRDGCGNQTGRVEFNPARVKTHYVNTITRLTGSSPGVSTSSFYQDSQSDEQHYQYSNSPVSSRMDIAYSSHESFIQSPHGDYACTSLSSSSTTTSYQNVSVSMSVDSYSQQPNYDYYHMQPSYDVDNSSMIGISSQTSTINSCCDSTNTASNGYLCTQPDNNDSYCYHNNNNNTVPANQQMISQYDDVATYQTILPPYVQDLHHSYDPSSSSEGSRESSASLDAAGETTLNFGELIKQSLVETALA